MNHINTVWANTKLQKGKNPQLASALAKYEENTVQPFPSLFLHVVIVVVGFYSKPFLSQTTHHFKVGVLYCKKDQITEEQMFGNC
jgi:hypothetical protein